MTLAEFLRQYGLGAFSVLGALIGVSFMGRAHVVTAAMAFLTGVAFAMVAAPIAVYYIDPDPQIRDNILTALGGLFSLVGFLICGSIYETVRHAKEWFPGFVRRWIDRKWGG